MNCLSCGSAITPGATFCENCGTAVARTGGAAPSGRASGGLKGSLGRPAAGSQPGGASSAWTTEQVSSVRDVPAAAPGSPGTPSPSGYGAAPGAAFQTGSANQPVGPRGVDPTMAMGAVAYGAPMYPVTPASHSYVGVTIGAIAAVLALCVDAISAYAASWPRIWNSGWQSHLPALQIASSGTWTTAVYAVLAVTALAGAICGFARVKLAPWILLAVGADHLIVFVWSMIWATSKVPVNRGKFVALLLDPRVGTGLGLLLLASLVLLGTSAMRRPAAAWSGLGIALFLTATTIGVATSQSPRSEWQVASSYSDNTQPSDSGSSGYSSDYDSDSSDMPSETTAPTIQSQATTLNGIWPAGAPWADQTCGSSSVVTALVLVSSQVAVCEGNSGGYTMHVIDGGSNFDAALPATYDKGSQLFTVADPSSPGMVKYKLSPTGLREYTNGELSSVQSTTSKQRGTVSESDLLAELVNLMWTSHDGRSAVSNLANSTYAGNPSVSCPSGSDASSTIDDVVANRTQMLKQGQDLASLAEGTSVETPAATFVEAMQHSLAADQSLSAWVVGTWSYYADAGCSGYLATTDDPDWATFHTESIKASQAKSTLANQVNPLAAETSLKSDWTEPDV